MNSKITFRFLAILVFIFLLSTPAYSEEEFTTPIPDSEGSTTQMRYKLPKGSDLVDELYPTSTFFLGDSENSLVAVTAGYFDPSQLRSDESDEVPSDLPTS